MLDDGGRVYFTSVRKPWGSMSERTVLKIGVERISLVDVEAAWAGWKRGQDRIHRLNLDRFGSRPINIYGFA